MKFFIEGKEDLVNLVSSQLKSLGVKVPKIKKSKVNVPKQQENGQFQPRLKVFGVRLDAQDVASNYSHLPKFILSCTDYLRKYTKEVGLFRKAGSVARQKNLRVKIENGGSFDGSEPNDVASLLKQWLRELPEPLIPSYLHDSFIRCQNLNNDESRIMSTLLMCLFLPPDHLYTLKHLLCFLAEIATDKEKNKMGAPNLALIMAPNIFALGTNFTDKSCNTKVQQYASVIQLLIENASKIGELPPYLSSKKATLGRACQSELNSPSDVESSPSISRKQYLLRSIKKLVKQNSTPPAIQTVSPDDWKTLSLKHSTAESVTEIKATGVATKGNGSLFTTRSSEDICKRSFGLLRKKEKKRLKIYSDCSSITQSLGIESSLDIPMEVDKPIVDSSIQEPLLEKESSIRGILAVEQFDEKISKLEDIEMTTFKMHVNNQNKYLQAFPIPSFSSSVLQAKPEILFSNLKTEDVDQLQEPHSFQLNEVKSTNLLEHIDVENLLKVTSSGTNEWVSNDKDSYCSKTPKRVQISCSPKTLQLFSGEYPNACQADVSPIKKINSSRSTESMITNKSEYCSVMNSTRNIAEMDDSADVEPEYLQSINSEILSKKSCNENLGMFQMKIRQDTFIIEPKVSSINEMEVSNEAKIGTTVFNDHSITSDVYKVPVQKKQCLSSNAKNKRSQNLQNKKVIKKSNNSVTVSCSKNKQSSRESALQKSRAYTNSVNSNKNKDIKLAKKQTSSHNIDFEKVNFPIFTSKENQCNDNNHRASPSILKDSEFSSSFESGQRKRKSTSMCPTAPSRLSDSKIPRLRNSFENSKANSYSEATAGHSQKVSKSRNIKETDSCDHPTRIPVKYDNTKTNLSTLQLSINDSCFLTPNRNALLSPNSVVWMSGNKYFVSSSPEEEQFNKRESIAMILKSNPGHVQAKVHLYDDLLRESECPVESVPCHSTPTSKFNKRLSSSSQSLKTSPKHRTKLQSSNSMSYSKCALANRSKSVQNEEKSRKLTRNSPKCNTHLNMPSPIKSYSLKDVTNKGSLLNASKNSKNVQAQSDTVSVFSCKNTKDSIDTRKKLKRNSFSGNTSQKLPKKLSRSESTPGPRPHRRVSCLIKESNCEK